MQAMVLHGVGEALRWTHLPDRVPGPNQVRVAVDACGVCRTDLHVLDGELPHPRFPIIPGHEIVGRIDAVGPQVTGLQVGQRVGVPWLGHTCGVCFYCRHQQENLCDTPLFTGYTRDGGFASTTIADARFALPLDETGEAAELAPLLCAGMIGWRSLCIAGDGAKLGPFGFGAAAHILAQVAIAQGRTVSLSRGAAISRPRYSHDASVCPGRAHPMNRRPSNSMRPSFSRPSVTWFRWH